MKRKPARRKSKSIVNRSVRKKLYRALIVGSLFLLSLTFLFSYSFYKYLNQNFASALSSSSYSILEDDIPTVSYIVAENLDADLIILKKVNFIIFDKSNGKVSIYNIPLNIDLQLPGKFGREQFSKMFALGGMNSSEPLAAGTEIINRSIFKLFGFKVDKFVLIDSSQESFFDILWHEGGFFNLLSLKDITSLEGSLKTDMNLREFYGLLSFINSLPQDRVIDESNPPKCYCNTQSFDDLIRESTYDSEIAEEKKNIAVLNGTDFNGLASFGARVITNIGGRVVAVNNTEKIYEKSVIITDEAGSKTAALLSRVFKIPSIITKAEAHSFIENEIDRSDITVVFGFDTSGDLY